MNPVPMSDYQSLIERVEGLSGPSLDVSGEICVALQYVGPFAPNPKNVTIDNDDPGWLLYELDGEECTDTIPSLTSSIDAALSLVERKLPDAYPKFEKSGGTSWHAWIMDEPEAEQGYYGINSSPALAILAALLRALQSQEEGR